MVGDPSSVRIEIRHALRELREHGGNVMLEYSISDRYCGPGLDAWLEKELGETSRDKQIVKVREALEGICEWTRKHAVGSRSQTPRVEGERGRPRERQGLRLP